MTSIRPKLAAALAIAGLALPGGLDLGRSRPRPGRSRSRSPRKAGRESSKRLLGQDRRVQGQARRRTTRPRPTSPSLPASLAPKDEGLDKLLEGLGETKDKPRPRRQEARRGGGGDPAQRTQARPALGDLKRRRPDDRGPLKPKLEGADQEEGRSPRRTATRRRGRLGPARRGHQGRCATSRSGSARPTPARRPARSRPRSSRTSTPLIEQMKNSPSQSVRAIKMLREGGKKPGPPQPGQPGNQPGAMANGTNKSEAREKPKTPPIGRSWPRKSGASSPRSFATRHEQRPERAPARIQGRADPALLPLARQEELQPGRSDDADDRRIVRRTRLADLASMASIASSRLAAAAPPPKRRRPPSQAPPAEKPAARQGREGARRLRRASARATSPTARPSRSRPRPTARSSPASPGSPSSRTRTAPTAREPTKGNIAVTSLAGLAFMANGSSPGRGPYGSQVDQGPAST